MDPQNNLQQTPPPLSPQPQLKNNHKIVWVLVSVLLLLLISSFCVWYFQIRGEKVVTEVKNEVVDETAGWKIYKNEEYGFEFKYPGKYSTGSYLGYDDGFSLDFIYENKRVFTVRVNPYGFGIGEGCDENNQVANVLVNNIKMVREIICGTVLYSFNLKDHEIFINNYGFSSLSEFDKILSTFKFIDKKLVIPPAGYSWKLTGKEESYFSRNVFLIKDYENSRYPFNERKSEELAGQEWLFKGEPVKFPDENLLFINGWHTNLKYKGWRIASHSIESEGGDSPLRSYIKLENNKLIILEFIEFISKDDNISTCNLKYLNSADAWGDYVGDPETYYFKLGKCQYESRVFLSYPIDIDSIIP